ncbi:MAG: efflux RND transporter periplasmic adaptor subunit [Anaerolineae bacterium]|nr:efflux RND transporter periplasmic adaptor subunit [Anaerolineae bacterium]
MKKSWIIVGIIGLVVLGVGGWWLYQQTTASVATATRVQTAKVQRGSLVATVNAAGNVLSPEEATLSFQTSGRVAKVYVQVGDMVKKGQVLMELDTTDLELSLKTAKANLASSQANLEQVKANLQFALRNAQSNLESSKAALEAAKSKNAQNANQIIIAKAQLDKAEVALRQAQGAYNQIAWRGDVSMTPQAAELQRATIDYQSALANYQMTLATINDSALKAAQAQYERDVVALEQAQRNLDTQLRTAQANVERDQIAVEQAQRNIERARIVAPFDGVVSAVNFSAGDSAGTATAVVVVDLSVLQVRVNIAEIDIAKIKVGQTAQVTLDALVGKTYNATISAIGPVATITQGVVNYPVIAIVDNTDGAIKPGMTANLSITVDRRDNVLLVPARAVRSQGNQRIVNVLYKGQTIATPVTIGLTNDQFAEVLGGLLEGDEVIVQTTTTRGTSGFGVPGMPPIGGR